MDYLNWVEMQMVRLDAVHAADARRGFAMWVVVLFG